MIVPSMTIQEIHKEVFEDFKTLHSKIEYLKRDFERIVLKSRSFPITRSFDCKTREKKNLFIVEFTALKRSAWKNPIISTYGIYYRPEGNYAVTPSLDLNISTIYPPHFFKRYRERIQQDKSISNEDLIRNYFKNDWGFMAASVNENFKTVFHCFEKDNMDEILSFVAATYQGYCFGEKQGNVNIIKTIISEEMLFEDQKNTFTALRTAFKDANKNRYGMSI